MVNLCSTALRCFARRTCAHSITAYCIIAHDHIVYLHNVHCLSALRTLFVDETSRATIPNSSLYHLTILPYMVILMLSDHMILLCHLMTQLGWEVWHNWDGRSGTIGMGGLAQLGWEVWHNWDGRSGTIGMGGLAQLGWEVWHNWDGRSGTIGMGGLAQLGDTIGMDIYFIAVRDLNYRTEL